MIHELSILLGMVFETTLSVIAVGLVILLVLFLIFTPIFFVGAFFSEEPYWKAIGTGYANLMAAWRRYF